MKDTLSAVEPLTLSELAWLYAQLQLSLRPRLFEAEFRALMDFQ